MVVDPYDIAVFYLSSPSSLNKISIPAATPPAIPDHVSHFASLFSDSLFTSLTCTGSFAFLSLSSI